MNMGGGDCRWWLDDFRKPDRRDSFFPRPPLPPWAVEAKSRSAAAGSNSTTSPTDVRKSVSGPSSSTVESWRRASNTQTSPPKDRNLNSDAAAPGSSIGGPSSISRLVPGLSLSSIERRKRASDGPISPSKDRRLESRSISDGASGRSLSYAEPILPPFTAILSTPFSEDHHPTFQSVSGTSGSPKRDPRPAARSANVAGSSSLRPSSIPRPASGPSRFSSRDPRSTSSSMLSPSGRPYVDPRASETPQVYPGDPLRKRHSISGPFGASRNVQTLYPPRLPSTSHAQQFSGTGNTSHSDQTFSPEPQHRQPQQLQQHCHITPPMGSQNQQRQQQPQRRPGPYTRLPGPDLLIPCNNCQEALFNGSRRISAAQLQSVQILAATCNGKLPCQPCKQRGGRVRATCFIPITALASSP